MERRRGADLQIEDFQNVARRKIYHPAEDITDPILPVLGQAVLDLTHERQFASELLEIASLPNRRDKSAAYLTNVLFMQVNEQHLELDNAGNAYIADPDFPNNLLSIDNCKDILRNIVVNQVGRSDNILHREIQTNWYPRYASLKIIHKIYEDLLGPHPSFLDLGASQNYGLKWLKRNGEIDKLPLRRIIVHDPAYYHSPLQHLPVDEDATSKLNDEYLLEKFVPGDCLGIDWYDIGELANKRWVAANARAGEFRDPHRIEILSELNKPVEGVNSISKVDCADSRQLAAALGGKKYDVVSLLMMLHQNTEQGMGRVIANAVNNAKKLVTMLEVVSIEKDDEDNLHMRAPDDLYDAKEPYNFKLRVLNLKRIEEGFQEIARFKNGRSREVIFNRENEDVARAFPG